MSLVIHVSPQVTMVWVGSRPPPYVQRALAIVHVNVSVGCREGVRSMRQSCLAALSRPQRLDEDWLPCSKVVLVICLVLQLVLYIELDNSTVQADTVKIH